MRLLITRPEPDAGKLKARLEALGHEATVEPLLRIEPLPIAADAFTGVQGLIATSRNALRALGQSASLATALALPIFTVGPDTSELARALGFEEVVEGPGTARDLPEFIATSATIDRGTLVHIAGEHVAFDIAGALVARGYEVGTLTVYRTVPASRLSERTAHMLARGDIDAVLLMSPRTAEIFAQLVVAAGLDKSARHLLCICLSEAVANSLGWLVHRPPVIAEAPSSSAMLAAIARVATQSTGV